MAKTTRAAKTKTEVTSDVKLIMEQMLENLLTAEEAATLLGTTAGRVRQLVLKNKIAAVKKGNLLILYKPHVLEYLHSRRTGRPPAIDKH